ncbi:hypothetical protein DAPPUDRAFT_311650 [Daphnia pulex]|uniref:Uncharacterized protein n=1 Tax=Daphnia pulex TaxID=6669 RepID=E9FXI1_DAPPU|nr:hypothetical protein DAPPUDRAFT_311650 [Daphnia pulex]|eukprot:EFX88264.1 hypothetical protein DAPPUDRAFT_311650 [Daphnia pulex]
MLPIVIVACLATMAMSAPTETRPTTTIVADGPEGRLLEAEEPGKGFWGYISSETDDGQVELQTMDGKTITTRLNQLSVSPAVLPGAYPYPMSPIAPGYGYRYFPGNTFPVYYPFYQQGQYDFDGNLETKSDAEELYEVINVNGDGTRQTPTPTPNPLAPLFNTIITMNNVQMTALTLANIFMLMTG